MAPLDYQRMMEQIMAQQQAFLQQQAAVQQQYGLVQGLAQSQIGLASTFLQGLSIFLEPRLTEERAALERSRTLLESWLSPVQRERFKLCREIPVVGSETGDLYIIVDRYSFNVRRVKDHVHFCAMINAPEYDRWLAQKLVIENDEPQFLRIANRTTML